MTLLVSLLVYSTAFFLGLTAFCVLLLAFGNAFAIFRMHERIQMLEHEVYGCPSETEPPQKPKKKRSYRRRKSTAKPSPRRGKGRRATREEPAIVD